MWLEQKIITFQCEKLPTEIQDLDFDSINLALNGNKTTVPLSKLFLKINDWEIDEQEKTLAVKGWSILQEVNPETGILNVKDKEIKVDFDSESFGKLNVIEVKNPLFQLDDKKFPDEDFNTFSDKIIELSEPPVVVVEDKTEESGLPHSDSSIINKKYEIGKQRFILNGFKEYVSGPYRLLIKQSEDKTLATFFEIISESEANVYQNIKVVSENKFDVFCEKDELIFKIFIENEIMVVEKITAEV